MNRSLALVVSLVLAVLSMPSARAQACLGPDGLDGPCWQPTTANLPAFPGLDLPGLGVCWKDCVLDDQLDVQVTMDTPLEKSCGQYEAALTVTAAGEPLLRGTLVLDYTRTWLELAPTAQYQVWRFMAKVDLSGEPELGNPCPIPSCLLSLSTAFYYGYVDLAVDCNTAEWAGVLVLFHNSDVWIHGQKSSAKGFGLHPSRNYAIVAPHTQANPFDPTASMSHPDGEILSGRVRNVGHPEAPDLCSTADRISSSLATWLGDVCLSGFGVANPPRGSAVVFRGAGTCTDSAGVPTWWLSLRLLHVIPVGVPWTFLQGTSIGFWTSDASYPGDERAVVSEGLFLFHDSCASAAGEPSLSLDFFYGAATVAGYLAQSLTGEVITQRFLDLASNYSQIGIPFPPLVGHVMPTKHLIYGNLGAS